jgi:hypothetical protein
VTEPPAEAQAEVDDGEGSAGPGEPKTATVERREASVPRHGTQGASLGAWHATLLRAHGCSAEHPNVSRRSAHPSWGVSEAKRQSPDAAMRARERVALFDIVKGTTNQLGDELRAQSPLTSAPRCGRYFAGLALALRSEAGSGVRPPSTSTAACSQVRAISSKTWRCRSDLVSPAQRKHSCANSRNSLEDAATARSF